MKKKLKTASAEPSASEAAAVLKTRKHGPEKEKVQITVRIDKDLMDQAYGIMKITNSRLTDMLERGLILAMKEEETELPLLTSQVRFLVANTTKAEQELLRGFLTYLRVDEVRKPSECDRSFRRHFYDLLNSLLPFRKEVMDLYSRYGRTQAEIEKLTG